MAFPPGPIHHREMNLVEGGPAGPVGAVADQRGRQSAKPGTGGGGVSGKGNRWPSQALLCMSAPL